MTTAQFFNRIALAAALALGTVGAAQAEGTIRIGAAGPQTGPAAQYGEQVFTGVQAAVDDFNKAGGVGGSKLEAVYYDDACDPNRPWRWQTRSSMTASASSWGMCARAQPWPPCRFTTTRAS